MDRFERFNVSFRRVIDRASPVFMLVMAIAITTMQLPLLLAVLGVGIGALFVFCIRRRVNDIEWPLAIYVVVMSAVELAGS